MTSTPTGPAPDGAGLGPLVPPGPLLPDVGGGSTPSTPPPPRRPERLLTSSRTPEDVLEGARAGTSRTMASWALGLSFLGCVPLAVLSGAGLAIATLVRARGSGFDHGRGRAIGALVVTGCWVFLLAAAVVVVATTDAEPVVEERASEPGRLPGPRTIPVDRLGIYDCFRDEALSEAGNETVQLLEVNRVPCYQAHEFEVFAEVSIDGEELPGPRAMRREVLGCLEQFKSFVGVSHRRSELEVMYLSPTPASWSGGDHSMQCIVLDPAGTVTASLHDAGR